MTAARGPAGRTLVLHIGPMKTGSTSIQVWLRRNAAALAAAGVALPLARVDTNLSPIVAELEPRRGKAEAPTGRGISLDALRAELDALPADAHTAVISAELMGQRMRAEAIGKLRAFLHPYFAQVRVVAYLRRQDELAVSRYSTTLRRGDRGRMFGTPIDYARMLDDWGAGFGRDSLRPRLFDRTALKDGDVIADFTQTAGLPAIAAESAPKELNPSLDVDAQALLHALTRRQRETGGEHLAALPGQARLVAYLERTHAGRGKLPSRAEAEAFLAQVADSNERVRREWFPDRARLFSADFARYPDAPTPDPPLDRRLDVALGALLALLADPDTAGPRGKRGKRRRREVEDAAAGLA